MFWPATTLVLGGKTVFAMDTAVSSVKNIFWAERVSSRPAIEIFYLFSYLDDAAVVV